MASVVWGMCRLSCGGRCDLLYGGRHELSSGADVSCLVGAGVNCHVDFEQGNIAHYHFCCFLSLLT